MHGVIPVRVGWLRAIATLGYGECDGRPGQERRRSRAIPRLSNRVVAARPAYGRWAAKAIAVRHLSGFRIATCGDEHEKSTDQTGGIRPVVGSHPAASRSRARWARRPAHRPQGTFHRVRRRSGRRPGRRRHPASVGWPSEGAIGVNGRPPATYGRANAPVARPRRSRRLVASGPGSMPGSARVADGSGSDAAAEPRAP